jgi:hypothetical protein
MKNQKKTTEQCLREIYDELYKQTGVDINSVGKSIAAHVDYGTSKDASAVVAFLNREVRKHERV